MIHRHTTPGTAGTPIRRRIASLVIAVALVLVALPANPALAHHSNNCDFDKQYWSIQSYVYQYTNCHCDTDAGYRVRMTSWTSGFGFADSTGAKGMIVSLPNSGSYPGVRWNPTEFDRRAHRWQTNYGTIDYWRFEHYYVWAGGDMRIVLDCGRGSTGTSSWAW